MNKENEGRNIIVSMAITIILIVWLIMSAGCSYRVNQHLKEDGHWPGWIVEPPLYGPHARQIELRNAYSDGWQDRSEAYNKYE